MEAFGENIGKQKIIYFRQKCKWRDSYPPFIPSLLF